MGASVPYLPVMDRDDFQRRVKVYLEVGLPELADTDRLAAILST